MRYQGRQMIHRQTGDAQEVSSLLVREQED